MASCSIPEITCQCLRTEPHALPTETLLATLSISDWENVIQFAGRYGLGPLIYHRVQTAGMQSQIPDRIFQRLRAIYLTSAAHNMRLYAQLADVLALLRDHNIPVIVLKGAYLAEIIYGNIALRPMDDIDLLCRETDLAQVVKLLNSAGYHPDTGMNSATRAHLPPFKKPEAFQVELHWTFEVLQAPFTMTMDEVWRRAQLAAITGVQSLILPPEESLLYLCLHTALRHHFSNGLQAFCDLAVLLQVAQQTLNWEHVWNVAHQWGIHKCVYLTLLVAQEVLSAAVPTEQLQAFQPQDFAPELAEQVKRIIFAPQETRFPMNFNLSRVWGARRFREKAVMLWQTAFPSPWIIATAYDTPKWSHQVLLYYLNRLRMLTARYGRSAWQLVRHDSDSIRVIHQDNRLINWFRSI